MCHPMCLIVAVLALLSNHSSGLPEKNFLRGETGVESSEKLRMFLGDPRPAFCRRGEPHGENVLKRGPHLRCVLR